jgi:hypothetical protein
MIRFGRSRPEPVIQREPPVDGDAVGTLQQFLNCPARTSNASCITRARNQLNSSPHIPFRKRQSLPRSGRREMPNGYRVRRVNRFESVGSPTARTLQPLQRSGQGLCMRSGAAVRSAKHLLPASQSVETNIDATGIPQYGRGVDGAGEAFMN